MMERVLGLDSGGTKTDAVVVEQSGAVSARISLEGLDPNNGRDWEGRLQALAAQIGPVSAAVLGMPYHDEIARISSRQSVLAEQLFGQGSIVLNDVAVAFEGALAGGDGVLVLAGTGSMAWSRARLGAHRVGGWGDVFGDEGSAYWIGCAALGTVSKELDGRKPSAGFANALLGRMGIAADDLMRWTYEADAPRAHIAGLARHVSDLSQAGQSEARDLMVIAARHLAELGLTAARLCGAEMPARWSFAGGVMNDPIVMETLNKVMGCAALKPVLPPVGGALLIAAKTAGWQVDARFIERLEVELTKRN